MAVGVNTTHRMVVLALGALRDDALPLSHHGLSGLLLAHLQLGIRVFVRASTLKNLKSLHSSTNVQRLRPAPSPAYPERRGPSPPNALPTAGPRA